RPVRGTGVVAQVDGRLGGEAATKLSEDCQTTDPGVEDADRARVRAQPHRGGQPRARTPARAGSRAAIEAAIARTPCETGASGLASTKGTPSLLAAVPSFPADPTLGG